MRDEPQFGILTEQYDISYPQYYNLTKNTVIFLRMVQDTLLRINTHPGSGTALCVDNPDSRRTNEPYAVGNVHYGTAHQCTGLNLYSWFSATPAWLIHGEFEEILGVNPEFNGLRINAADIDGWDSYQLTRTYRGTKYHISFVRTGKKAIYMDKQPIEGNVVYSDKAEVFVDVEF